MSSKVNLRSSKQSRPKSSDKSKTGKKGGGTPEKSATPNLSSEALGDNGSPQSQNIIMGEDIAKLAIRDEDLQQLRTPKPPSEDKQKPPVKLTVRKLKPTEELEHPKPQKVTVFKPAPPTAPLRPMDYSGIAGPRYDLDGTVLPYSILGPYDDFQKEALAKGDLLDLPLPNKDDIQPRCPTVKYERKSRSSTRTIPRPDENNALHHWQLKMRERKRQQGYISKLLQKPPQSLVMNQADSYHKTQEDRYIIDRTIPLVDYGKGYRVGSEFWRQEDVIGDEMTGLHVTLSQTERGFPPPIEHVGLAEHIKTEKGYWSGVQAAPVHYPWHKSPYLDTRQNQLKKYMDDLDPHQPDFSSLAVVGSSRPCEVEDKAPNVGFTDTITEYEAPEGEITELEEEAMDVTNDPLEDHPDVRPAPIFGPSLLFAGQHAQWTGDSTSLQNEAGIEARVTFENYTGKRVTSFLEITNDGTTSIYYNWKQLPKGNPFDLVHAKVQRFYFNTSDGVILPGDTMRFPFVFKSPNAGVFTEQWKFETRPVVCGGASLIVSLRGIALQEDTYKPQREELQDVLSHREAHQIVDKILHDLLDTIRSPEPPRSPVDAYITEEEIFNRLNPEFYFHYSLVEELKELYISIFPEEEKEGKEWNLSLQDLKQTILEMEEDETESKQTLLQRLNLTVIDLSFTIPKPMEDSRHRVGHQLLVEAVDSMVKQAISIRSVLGMVDSESDEAEEEEEIIEPVKRPESSKSRKGRRSPGADSKKHKHAADKKDVHKEAAKKGPAAKDTKPAKGKETQRPESKGKTTPAPKGKTPVPVKGDSAQTRGERSLTPPTSPICSPIHPPKDLHLYNQYKERLYSQVYQILGDSVDKLEASLLEIRNVEGAPNLETLIFR